MLLKNTAFILPFPPAALPSAGARTVTGSLVGRVADASDAVIVGAKVPATEITRNVARGTIANDQDIYTIASLEPGVYRVEVEKEGFKKFVHERLEVNINPTVPVDAAMQVGGITEAGHHRRHGLRVLLAATVVQRCISHPGVAASFGGKPDSHYEEPKCAQPRRHCCSSIPTGIPVDSMPRTKRNG
jgi:hypothetical protein